MTPDDIERTADYLDKLKANLPAAIEGKTADEIAALVRVAATALRQALNANAALVERIGQLADDYDELFLQLSWLQDNTGIDATIH